MSFKKKDKIKKQIEIKNIIYSGEKVKSHYIDYFFKKSKNKRMAVLLNRTIKKANKRNKIKRRIREIYRTIEKNNKIDIVLKIKTNVIHEKYKTLKNDVKIKIENIERKREKSE